MHEQPDSVCGCGKTSEGLCPRCGQIASQFGGHLKLLADLRIWNACDCVGRVNALHDYLESLLRMDFLVLLVDVIHTGSELVPLTHPEGQCMQWGLSLKSLLETVNKMRELIRAGLPKDKPFVPVAVTGTS